MHRPAVVAAAALAVAASACGGAKKAATTPDANGCVPVDMPSATQRNEPRPTKKLDPARTYDVRFQTNCGSFTVRLGVRPAPVTTSSFASLVQKHFFDGTVFHRIAVGFVIQGGDPTQTGGGGPGYTTVENPPLGTQYTHGVVAMAKTPAEAAGTAGSQFFVVTAPNAKLPAEYAVLGRVVKGLAVVDRIGKLGDPGQQPTETVEIEHATLTAS